MFSFFRHLLYYVTRTISAILLKLLQPWKLFPLSLGQKKSQPRLTTVKKKSCVTQMSHRKRRTPLRSYAKISWFVLALVLTYVMGLALPSQSLVGAANYEITIQLPLSTQGSAIIDAANKPVLLRGVNWFGIETDKHAPHGLWKRDYKEMLSQIKSLGYNMIRLPYSVQSLRVSEVSGIDFSIGTNQELYDKSPLEVMDEIIKEAERQELLILLDSHRLNDQRIPELWYDDEFTEEDWLDTWKMLAQRYQNQANVIGADLKNEPHGRASWGTDDQETDWRLAAERAGNAILDINPNWLIVVEGVENNVPGQKLKKHWMGANLEGVRKFGVRLSHPQQLVYSIHEYGPGVFAQPWFSEPSFPNNLNYRWETGWHYIATEGIAPVWIGEFGGRQTDGDSPEGIWQQQFTDYIRQKDLGFAYWSWNPNSTDTGGLLQDDWLSVEEPKQELLQEVVVATRFAQNYAKSSTIDQTAQPQPTPLVAVKPTPNEQPRSPVAVKPTPNEQPPSPVAVKPTPNEQPRSPVAVKPTPNEQPPSPVAVKPTPNKLPRSPVAVKPTPNEQPNPSIPKTNKAQLKVASNLQSDWDKGFCMSIQVSNQGKTKVNDWQLTFEMNQATINNSWNGNFQSQGSQYQVSPLDWGRVIKPGESRELGFCTNKLGSDYQPRQLFAAVIGKTSNTQPTVSFAKSAHSQLQVTSNLQSDWQTGFCVDLQVTNQGKTKVRDWQVKFQMNQAAINNSWNGNFQSHGSHYVVTPLDWGRVIEPRESRELGFCANKLGSDYQPRQLSVLGS